LLIIEGKQGRREVMSGREQLDNRTVGKELVEVEVADSKDLIGSLEFDGRFKELFEEDCGKGD